MPDWFEKLAIQVPNLCVLGLIVWAFLRHIKDEGVNKRAVHSESMNALQNITSKFDATAQASTKAITECTAAHARTEKVIEQSTRVIERLTDK